MPILVNCTAAAGDVSIFLDLQSTYISGFLAGFPDLQRISGKNMLFEKLVGELKVKLQTAILTSAYITTAIAKDLKTIKKFSDQKRLTLVNEILRNIKILKLQTGPAINKTAYKKNLKILNRLLKYGVS